MYGFWIFRNSKNDPLQQALAEKTATKVGTRFWHYDSNFNLYFWPFIGYYD